MRFPCRRLGRFQRRPQGPPVHLVAARQLSHRQPLNPGIPADIREHISALDLILAPSSIVQTRPRSGGAKSNRHNRQVAMWGRA